MVEPICDISFSWKVDKSPSAVTSYTFNDVNSEDADEEDKRYEFQGTNVLQLVKDEESAEEDEHCILHLSCSEHDFASINCIAIISESRTLELSNDTEGYITTVRGRQINKDSPDSGCMLYCCKCAFRESYTNLTVKFLSLGERTSFRIYSLILSISQDTEGRQLHTRGTLDLDRLKRDVDEMGNVVPDRARDLLATMEQFKQNKLKNFEDLMGLQHQNLPQSLSCQNQGFSSIMNSILGAGSLKSLLGESNMEIKASDGGSSDVYKMLQKVCGSVSSMRAAATASRENENSNATASPDSGLDASCHNSEDEKHTVAVEALMTFVEDKVNQAKTELHTEFMEFKREITLHISQTTAEINEKLDKIMCMLKDIQGTKE